jgi:hypothetical protein
VTGPIPPGVTVTGRPSDAELAALTGVLMALAAAPASDEPAPSETPGWRSRSRQLRLPPTPGRGAWKASVRP